MGEDMVDSAVVYSSNFAAQKLEKKIRTNNLIRYMMMKKTTEY